MTKVGFLKEKKLLYFPHLLSREPPLSISQLIILVIHHEYLVVHFHHVVVLLKVDDVNTMHIEALDPLVIQVTCMEKSYISLRGDWTHSLKRRLLRVINTQELLPVQKSSEPKTVGD